MTTMKNSEIPSLDSFREYFYNATGKLYDIYYESYFKYLLRIPEESDKLTCFKELLTRSILPDGEYETKEYHTKEEYEKLIKKASSVMSGILENLVESKPTEEEFYKKLFEIISMQYLFNNDEDRVGAILFLILSPFIPYYCLEPGLKMDEEEFHELTKESYPALTKLGFILNSKLDQRTEVSSLILKVFEEIDDERLKAVLMANFIGYFEYRIQNAEKQDR